MLVSMSALIKEAVAYESTLGIAIKPHLKKKTTSKLLFKNKKPNTNIHF